MDWAARRSRLAGARRRPVAIAFGIFVAALGIAFPVLAAEYTVKAQDFEFVAPGGGATLTVLVADQVTWVASGDPHTVTSGSPGAIDDRFVDRPASAGFLFDGTSFTTNFPATGTYPYFCEVHPETMRGSVIVVAASAPTPMPTPTPTKQPTPPPTAAPTATPAGTGPMESPSASATADPVASESPKPSGDAGRTSAPAGSPLATTSATPDSTPKPTDASAGSGSTDGLIVIAASIAGAAVLGWILLAVRRGRGRGGRP